MKSNLGNYFVKAQRRLRKSQRSHPAFWPEYVTSTQPKIRRVISEARSTAHTSSPVRSSVTGKYQSTLAQTIAKSQVAKSRRQGLPKKITPRLVIAWGSWGIGMSFFAASLFLNAPLPLGNFVMQQIPGQPRLGSLQLVTEKENLIAHDEFTVIAKISNTGTARVYGVDMHVQYDHAALTLQSIQTDTSVLQKTAIAEIDSDHNDAHVVLLSSGVEISETEPVAIFHFRVKNTAGNTTLRFSDDTSILTSPSTPTRPKKQDELVLNIGQPTLASRTLIVQKKQDPLVLNGDLSDWRDVVHYSPASFKPQGTVIGPKNLVDGTLADEKDAGGVFQVAEDVAKISFALFATDDEITPQDVVGIKLVNTVYAIHVQKALDAMVTDGDLSARAQKVDGGYTLEVVINRSSLGQQTTPSFNFEIDDYDSDTAGRLLLSSPNDSKLSL